MTDDFSALEEATMRIDELEYELSDAELKIQRVRELHTPEPRSSWNPDDPLPEVCRFCRYVGEAIPELGDVYVYPCPTIKALDGENNG